MHSMPTKKTCSMMQNDCITLQLGQAYVSIEQIFLNLDLQDAGNATKFMNTRQDLVRANNNL